MLNKLMLKYKSVPVQAKASFWFTICSIFQKGIQFIVVPIYTRLLTTEEYGEYMVFISWLQIITIFATLNLSYGVFNNGMLKFEKDRYRYISSMQGLSSLSTIIVFLICIVLKYIFKMDFSMNIYMISLMFIQIFLSPPFSYWSTLQRYKFKYFKLLLITFFMSVLTPIVSITLLLFTNLKSLSVIIGYVSVQALVGLVFFVFNVYKGKKLFVKKYWIFALKFNLPLIPHYFSMIMLSQVDKIMISHYYGNKEAGIYGLAQQISLAMNIILTGITSSLMPWTYHRLSKNESIKNVCNIILLFFSTLSILIVLVVPEVLKIMSTSEYMEAIWVMPPITISVFFTLIYSYFVNVEFYLEESKYVMIASALCAGIKIVLNCICIPNMGYISAGYTTLICYMILALIHYFFMIKCIKKNSLNVKIYNYKFIVMVSIILTVISIILTLFYDYIVIRYILFFIIVSLVMLNMKKIKNILCIIKNG